MKIRKAQTQDMLQVYNLVCELEEFVLPFHEFEPMYIANLAASDIYYFVAEEEKSLVGFISCHVQNLLHHTGRVGEIQEFVVAKAHQKKGIGRQLMDVVFALAKKLNFKSLEVTTNKKRTANAEIYQRYGFGLTHHKLVISYENR